ncbi:MAG: pitrilysin family protein [bacterium]
MPKISRHTFSSGLRLLAAPADQKTVTVLVLVGAGSKYETKDEAGLSHFLEHMFFKGSKKRPSAKIVAEFMDQIGGEYNAFTHKEFTGYYAKVAKQHAPKAFDFISDMLQNAKLPAIEIEREKGVIIEEMNMYQDTPMRYIGDLFEQLLYGNQPGGRLIIGSKKTVRSMIRKQFVDYKKDLYVAKNIVVGVAGGISENKSRELVKIYFANKLPKEEPRVMPETKDKQVAPQIKLFYKKTDQSHLSLGVRAFDMYDKKRYALSILSALLGGYMSSRLFIAVRERRGLAYYVRSSVEAYKDTGYLAITAGCDNSKAKEAIAIIIQELKKIKKQTVPAKELKKAKEHLKGQTMMSLEDTSESAVWIAVNELFRQKVPSLNSFFKKIDAVTAADIKEVAQEIFTTDKLNLAMISPHQDTKSFLKLLAL